MLAIVALLAIAIVVLQLIIFAAFLRLFARWRRVETISWRRAIVAVFVISIVNLGTVLALAWLADRHVFAGFSELLLLFIVSAPQFAVALVVVKAMLHIGWPKAMLVGWGSLIAASVVSLTIAFVMRATLFEAFVVPTGGMATTILGQHVDLSCANCGYVWPAALPPAGFDESRLSQTRVCPQCAYALTSASPLQAKNGDRVLLFKRSFPKRWQLAVFDTPEENSEKYVKRLIGMPGETIEIAGGDLFASGKRLRKEPHAQDDLWYLVHDTQFIPAEALPNTRRWASEDGTDLWKQANGQWVFQNGGDLEDELRFSGPVDDSLSYNVVAAPESQSVNDIRLDCHFNRLTGKGSVLVRWRFGETSIDATCFPDGKITFGAQLSTKTAREQVESAGFRPDSEQPLRFLVRDGVACLSQAKIKLARIAFDDRNASDLVDAYRESANQLTIVAKHCNVEIRRLVLYRDVYYRSMDEFSDDPHRIVRFALADGEFFFLGDNSTASRDCRFLGPIKQSAINGVLVCRYWPPKRWHSFD